LKALVAVVCVLWCAVAVAGEIERARALVQEGKLDEAEAVLLTTVKDPAQKGESLTLLARLYTRQGEWDTAVDHGKQATKNLLGSAEAHFAYAVALRQKMLNGSKMKAMFSVGDYKDALARARELDPENLEAREEEIGFLMAPSIVGGDLEQAKVRTAELKARDRVRGLLVEASLLYRLEKPDEALKAIAEVLVLRPDDHRLRLRYVNLLQAAKRFADAERELDVLARVTDGTWAMAATYQRARSRILGRFEQARAVELLTEYIAKAPEGGSGLPSKSAAYWRLGNAHEQMSERDKAKTAYRQALALDPKNDEAKKALKALSP
jgi:tetratricopeptide (TPR) repeat protein